MSAVLKRDEPNAQAIHAMFSSISSGYDSANRLMTFGLDQSWRRQLVAWAAAPKDAKVLDCATGTGDLAILFKKELGPGATVIGSDFCEDMLNWARPKGEALGVRFETADLLNLPYPDREFDVVSVAYGLRNVANLNQALQEIIRVTKSQGRILILETGRCEVPWMRPLLKLHFQIMVPLVGTLITGKPSAYSYLNSSSQEFPGGREFVNILEGSNGIEAAEYRRLMWGASYLYRAVRS